MGPVIKRVDSFVNKIVSYQMITFENGPTQVVRI